MDVNDDPTTYDLVSLEFLGSGETGVLHTHGTWACDGHSCCIHRPSDHPLRGAPLVWDGRAYRMHRRCEHGQIHPDPDHVAYLENWERQGAHTVSVIGPVETPLIDAQRSHDCDGCCGQK